MGGGMGTKKRRHIYRHARSIMPPAGLPRRAASRRPYRGDASAEAPPRLTAAIRG